MLLKADSDAYIPAFLALAHSARQCAHRVYRDNFLLRMAIWNSFWIDIRKPLQIDIFIWNLLRIDMSIYFDNTGMMETIEASERLAALGHETRLAIFRRLVQTGPEGVSAGSIGEHMDLPAATLSFHLAHLSRVGLIKGRQEGRYIYYSADYSAMDELLTFLTHNCCQGEACPPLTSPGKSASKTGVKRQKPLSLSTKEST